jgi:hypothetical protein
MTTCGQLGRSSSRPISRFNRSTGQFDQSIGRFVGWLIGQSIGRFVGWLIGQSIGRFVDRSVRRLVDRSIDRSVRRLVDRSIDRSVRRLVDRSVPRLVDRSIDRSVRRLVDRSVRRLIDRSVDRSVVSVEVKNRVGEARQMPFGHARPPQLCPEGFVAGLRGLRARCRSRRPSRRASSCSIRTAT